ncbi:MAG: tyrosine-protein kinase family protein [Candidatus Helarchaeota archaeon]
MGKITIAIHSYKGGTGKTTMCANLGYLLANRGYNICIADLDFRAPSLHVFFKHRHPRAYITDYLEDKTGLNSVLLDQTKNLNITKGRLFTAFSNPNPSEITKLLSKDKKAQMKVLKKLIEMNQFLHDKFVPNIDVIFLDSSPGLMYDSINSLTIADVAILIMRGDNLDTQGSTLLLNDIYTKIDGKVYVLLNKVQKDFNIARARSKFKQDILNVIPCYCEIQNHDALIASLKLPKNHHFNNCLNDVVSKLEKEIKKR